MRSSAQRVVGIIGGMGPEATVELMRRVIAATPADDDQDHIHLIIESNPKIPSRIAHLVDGSGADPKPELLRIARNLKAAGADALAMPCNTAHCYAAAIEEAASIPLLDMVELTAGRLAALRPMRGSACWHRPPCIVPASMNGPCSVLAQPPYCPTGRTN